MVLLLLILCRSCALAWSGIEPVQQLFLPNTSLHLPSHLLSPQDLLSESLLLLQLQSILPRLLVLIRILWGHASLRSWDFLANYCPAFSSRQGFSLGSNLASSSATARHWLSVLPRTHPLCCLGNRPNVGGRAGTVHVCVARCYRELP